MTRDEKIRRVREMREQGMTYAKIAKELGIVKSTAYFYTKSPDGGPTGRPKKDTGGKCERCDKKVSKLYKSQGQSMCAECLCPPFEEQKVEDFLRGSSAIAEAEEVSESAIDGFGRRSKFSRALNKAMKKRGMHRITPNEWAGGVE